VGIQAGWELPGLTVPPPVTRAPVPIVAPQPTRTWQVELQPFASVTVRVNTPVPDAPAVYVIVCVFAPAVIIQPLLLPLSDQLYETNPAGPLKVLPAEPQAGNGIGGARLQTGLQLTVMICVHVA